MGSFKAKIFKNSAWMIGEKGINVLGLFFVNSFMAKYIGPENFGKIAFASSLFVFVQTFSWFGAQNILFKRMSEKKLSGVSLAINTQTQRVLLFLSSSILILVYLFLFSDIQTFVFGLAYAAATYYIVSDFFSVYNNSQLNSHVNTVTNVIGLVVALVLRYVITLMELPVYYFTLPIIVISGMPYILRKFYFNRENISVINRSKSRYNKYLFLTGGALLFSTLSITLYTQVSNLFLAKLVSYQSLGIYMSALTIGGSWGLITQAIITSYFSKIYAERDQFQSRIILRSLNILIILLTFSFLVFIYLFGRYLVLSLYGKNYVESLTLIPLIVIATMFSSLGTIAYRYMIKLGAYKYLSIKMTLISLISIPVSYLFVSYGGVLGAAWCYLVLELFSCTIANYFFNKGCMFHIHLDIFKIKKIIF